MARTWAVLAALAGDGWKQMALSASKVPLLSTVTFLFCVPSFDVLNALVGLRDDFPETLEALLEFQFIASIVLPSLAPMTTLMNLTTVNYPFILLWMGCCSSPRSFRF